MDWEARPAMLGALKELEAVHFSKPQPCYQSILCCPGLDILMLIDKGVLNEIFPSTLEDDDAKRGEE